MIPLPYFNPALASFDPKTSTPEPMPITSFPAFVPLGAYIGVALLRLRRHFNPVLSQIADMLLLIPFGAKSMQLRSVTSYS